MSDDAALFAHSPKVYSWQSGLKVGICLALALAAGCWIDYALVPKSSKLGAIVVRVNIFQAAGDEQITGLEAQINGWVERTEALGFSVEIKHCSTAMCQISYGPNEERLPQLVVTVWYELAPRH